MTPASNRPADEVPGTLYKHLRLDDKLALRFLIEKEIKALECAPYYSAKDALRATNEVLQTLDIGATIDDVVILLRNVSGIPRAGILKTFFDNLDDYSNLVPSNLYSVG
jgi:hypothetical protein